MREHLKRRIGGLHLDAGKEAQFPSESLILYTEHKELRTQGEGEARIAVIVERARNVLSNIVKL